MINLMIKWITLWISQQNKRSKTIDEKKKKDIKLIENTFDGLEIQAIKINCQIKKHEEKSIKNFSERNLWIEVKNSIPKFKKKIKC